MKIYINQTQKLRFVACQTYPILHALNRRAELTRLVRWAYAKRATGPLRLYRSRLIDEERRLVRKSLAYPLAYKFARLLFFINRAIARQPRYFQKGSAQSYRY